MSPYFTYNEVVLFGKAIDWFNRNTCIRWTPKQRTDSDFVNIAKQGGCRAFVGRARVKSSVVPRESLRRSAVLCGYCSDQKAFE